MLIRITEKSSMEITITENFICLAQGIFSSSGIFINTIWHKKGLYILMTSLCGVVHVHLRRDQFLMKYSM